MRTKSDINMLDNIQKKKVSYTIWFYVNIIISKSKNNKNIYLLDNKYVSNNTIKSYWSPKELVGAQWTSVWK